MEEKKFQPYVPADKVVPEFTVFSVVLGALLAIVFGGANAYLGLRVGMTVSASIPAAVLSMGAIRFILKRDSILENNMVQTIGSAGESVAAGAIFTMPALFMWAAEGLCDMPSVVEIGLIALCGGVLGVLMMIPLRSALIVQEHGKLGYPEGKACAEVLMAGEEGGSRASTVFWGLGIAAVYKFVTDGLKLFPSEVEYGIDAYKGSAVGVDVLPALAGVGYICGPRISSYMVRGQHARVVRAHAAHHALRQRPRHLSRRCQRGGALGDGRHRRHLGQVHPLHRRGSAGGGRHHQPDQVSADDRAHVRRGLQVLR